MQKYLRIYKIKRFSDTKWMALKLESKIYLQIIVLFQQFTEKNNYIMFEYVKEDLDHEVSFNSFKQQVFHKMMLIQQHIYHFQCLNNSKVSKGNSGKQSIEVIKSCRKAINEIQKIIISFKSYLLQLNLEFFYDIIYKMFKVLIISFNGLCKKFTAQTKTQKIIETQEAERELDATLFNRSTQRIPTRLQNPRNQSKQIEYFDFVIKSLQQQEKKIQDKKKIMQKQFQQQARSLKSINASDTVNQLQNLDKQLQKIINNSYKIAGQSVLYRCQELSKKIISLKKPQQIQQQFCDQFSGHIKSKFMTTMERIIKELYYTIRYKQKQQMILQIQEAKPKLISISVQTQSDAKSKQIQHLNRDKKALLSEMQSIKKTNNILTRQVDKLSQKLKQSKEFNFNLEKKVDELDNQIRRKTEEITQSKAFNQKSIQGSTNMKFKQKSLILQKSDEPNIINEAKQLNILHTHTEENDSQDRFEVKSFKSKLFIKEKTGHNNMLHNQKSSYVQKKQNNMLKDVLLTIIYKLQQLKLIDNMKVHQISKNSKVSELMLLIQEIICQLTDRQNNKNSKQSHSLTPNNIRRQTKQNASLADIFKTTNSFRNFAQQSVQVDQQQIQKLSPMFVDNTLFMNKNEEQKQRFCFSDNKRLNKLETLKQQFLQKVTMNKKQKTFIKSSAKKYIEKTNNHEPILIQNSLQLNKTLNNFPILESLQFEKKKTQINQKQINKPRYSRVMIFNKSNISFQEFNINKNQNKLSHHTYQKKLLTSNSLKKRQNLLTQQDQSVDTSKFISHTNKPIISLQNYEILKEVKGILDMVTYKNDKNNYFLKSFIQTMLEQIKRIKGKPFIEQLLKKQIKQTSQKMNKNDQKLNKYKFTSLQINNLR